MGSYEIVDKSQTPKDLTFVKFNFKNNLKYGMLNVCSTNKEIVTLDDLNTKITNDQEIEIYFPLLGDYYVKAYSSRRGFTLKRLLECIVKIATQAGKHAIRSNPHEFTEEATYKDFIGEYSITSDRDMSDIRRKKNRFYISLQS